MSKDQINQFDSTAANNTDIEGINTSETMVPSAVNNSIRSLMSLLKKQDVGTHAMTSPNIDGGTVDGANITVGSGKTLNVSAGTLTLADDQISGDKINGGSISSTFVGNLTGDVTGNADTATALATARTIGGVSFDGTGNINLPGVNTAGNQNTSGTAATVTTAAQPAITSVGNLTSLNIVGTTTSDFLVIQTNEDGAGTAPDVTLYRNSTSPADNDYLGKIEYRGRNDNSQDVQYGYIAAQAVDVSDGTEDGRLLINAKINGADYTHIQCDPNGVGIGAAASDPLHIYKAAADSTLRFQWDATHAGKISFREGGTETGQIEMHSPSDSVQAGNMLISTTSSGAAGKAIVFETNSAEAMRILSGGNVGIGISNPSETLSVTGSFNATSSIKSLGVYNNTTGTAANLVVDSAGSFARSTSSRRYKNTITDATNGLTELLALRPVTYKHNGNGDTVFGGLIAEEVHDAGLTEFVQYNDDEEPDALAYGNMVSLCIKAIQEQQEKIDALEARIAILEGE